VHQLHSNWRSQRGTKTTDCAQSFELTLMQNAKRLRIRGGVLDFEEDPSRSIIRLCTKRYLGMGTPLAKGHKSRVDRNAC
jgi:hypothetical protein